MSRTGNHPHLITQNLHSMGSINFVLQEYTLKTPNHVYWMITRSNKVGVVSGYAHLITSGDQLIDRLLCPFHRFEKYSHLLALVHLPLHIYYGLN